MKMTYTDLQCQAYAVAYSRTYEALEVVRDHLGVPKGQHFGPENLQGLFLRAKLAVGIDTRFSYAGISVYTIDFLANSDGDFVWSDGDTYYHRISQDTLFEALEIVTLRVSSLTLAKSGSLKEAYRYRKAFYERLDSFQW